MMKMKASEKEYLLSQIAQVLSQLESLVSKLSSVQCQEESPAEDDVSSVYSQLSGSLSWDNSEDFPTLPVPSSFYSLLFPDSSDEEMESISTKCQNVRKPTAKKCPFVNKISSFLSSTFPDGVYNKKFKEDLIFVEFQTMWRNVGDLFVQKPDESAQNCTTTSPSQEIVFKTIDFSKVNVRNMANIPKPSCFPIHGVSNDPEFYKKTYWVKGFEYDKKEINYFKPSPHGSIYGYQTNDGIVPVPDVPVHGHVWSDHLHNWVLHAIYPEERPAARAPWTGPGPPTRRRPPSTRRGWPTSRSGGRK